MSLDKASVTARRRPSLSQSHPTSYLSSIAETPSPFFHWPPSPLLPPQNYRGKHTHTKLHEKVPLKDQSDFLSFE